jgi:hypothetical protein
MNHVKSMRVSVIIFPHHRTAHECFQSISSLFTRAAHPHNVEFLWPISTHSSQNPIPHSNTNTDHDPDTHDNEMNIHFIHQATPLVTLEDYFEFLSNHGRGQTLMIWNANAYMQSMKWDDSIFNENCVLSVWIFGMGMTRIRPFLLQRATPGTHSNKAITHPPLTASLEQRTQQEPTQLVLYFAFDNESGTTPNFTSSPVVSDLASLPLRSNPAPSTLSTQVSLSFQKRPHKDVIKTFYLKQCNRQNPCCITSVIPFSCSKFSRLDFRCCTI